MLTIFIGDVIPPSLYTQIFIIFMSFSLINLPRKRRLKPDKVVSLMNVITWDVSKSSNESVHLSTQSLEIMLHSLGTILGFISMPSVKSRLTFMLERNSRCTWSGLWLYENNDSHKCLVLFIESRSSRRSQIFPAEHRYILFMEINSKYGCPFVPNLFTDSICLRCVFTPFTDSMALPLHIDRL